MLGQKGQMRESGNALQNALGVVGVQPDGFPLLGGEFAGLVEDGVGNAELADIVQQRGAPQG